MRLLLAILLSFSSLVLLKAQERVTLLFAGDLMQHQSQLNAARRAGGGEDYDYSTCFSFVKDEVMAADVAIANLEVPLGGRRYSGYPMFCAPDTYLAAIKDAGFDLLLTANNHCMDRGAYGLRRTNHMIDSLGLLRCGTYPDTLARTVEYPLLIRKNGFRIALLNYTYGTNGLDVPSPLFVNFMDTSQISRDIKRAKELSPHIIIACMHWGEEYRSQPEPWQRNMAEWLLAKGVDHVIGSHPHVLQPIELHRHAGVDKPQVVAYSLGNYLSGMYERTKDGGLMLTMTFEKLGTSGALLTDCSYRLVWVARPERDGVANFTLIPAGFPADSLPPVARQKFNEFLNDSRTLFRNHNIGSFRERQ